MKKILILLKTLKNKKQFASMWFKELRDKICKSFEEIENKKILKKFNVKLIGASQKVINKAEDRELFKKAMKKIGIETPKGFIVNNLKESERALKNLDFPIIVRPSFTLGGLGGGIAKNKKEFFKILRNFNTSAYGEIYLLAYKMFINNPITGIGINNFKYLCETNDFYKNLKALNNFSYLLQK